MHLEETKRTLMRSDLFQGLRDSYLDIILIICEEARYVAGEYIFREGDPGDSIYLIAQGTVEVLLEPRSDTEEQIPVTTMAPTSTFGELTLVEENGRRTASVRCRTDAQLVRLGRDRLFRLCNDYPGIGFRVMHRIAAELAAKLRSSNLSIREYYPSSKLLVEDDAAALGDLPSSGAGTMSQRGKLPGQSRTSEEPPIDAPDPA
jgi:CRP/FNR family transcriptional regulator, cyclic AMP receptor protein